MLEVNSLVVEDVEDDCENESNNPFDQLPDELVVNIFHSLDLSFVATDVSLVCRRFRNLVLDPSLWTTLCLPSAKSLDSIAARRIVERCTLLRILHLHNSRPDSSSLAQLALRSAKASLEAIEMCQEVDQLENLFRCIGDCRSLRRLRMFTVVLKPQGVLELNAPCLRKLTHLDFFGCRGLDNATLRALADHCGNLQVFNMEEVTLLDNASTNYFIEKLGGNLKELYIDGESLDDECFKNLGKCFRLVSLGVTFADQMGFLGMRSIASLSMLERLKIKRGKCLKDSDFAEAFSEDKLCRLRELDLSECAGLGDKGAATVASGCPRLTCLALNWCWEISDDGVRCLLRRCPLLREIELLGLVRLSSEGLENIETLLPMLSRLDLEQCPNVDDDKLLLLKNKMPNLTVVTYYGERLQCSSS